MYIAKLHVESFRCFDDFTVDFRPGVNVIIGENNAGKTCLLRAVSLIFNRDVHPRFGRYDFYQGIVPSNDPPEITVTATICSSSTDTVEDKALVATWLTKLSSPWEATLTFRHFLPEEEVSSFREVVGHNPGKERFWREVERFLPKYRSRVYGGNKDSQIVAESEWLDRFACHDIDAIRDVEKNLFSGANPMLGEMLNKVLDLADEDRKNKEDDFRDAASELSHAVKSRLSVERLFELVEATGAKEAGKPDLAGTISERKVIAALELFVGPTDMRVPATHNGLGYNNLLYISLVLASLDLDQSTAYFGSNAKLFPILLIEEPEAHLHPALQYKLLKYLRKRIKEKERSRQMFLTTHSTHVTSAVDLDSIICMSAADQEVQMRVSYPGRVFPDDDAGRQSKKYVERFLDATKSNMLFAKGIILVEGLAEQLLLPCLAEYLRMSLEDSHVAVIAVGGSTFKHFLPLFGAGVSGDRSKCSLKRNVACLVDADPMRKSKEPGARWRRCLPCQIDCDPDKFEFQSPSFVVRNLKKLCDGHDHIRIDSGENTLEYDLAFVNSTSPFLITNSCKHAQDLRKFATSRKRDDQSLSGCVKDDDLKALATISDETEQRKARFAAYYLRCTEDSKGEHAFELATRLRRILDHNKSRRVNLTIPEHIEKAIQWVCRRSHAEENR